MELAEAVLKGDSQMVYDLQAEMHSDSDEDDDALDLAAHEHHPDARARMHESEWLAHHDSAHCITQLLCNIQQDKDAAHAVHPCRPPAFPPPQMLN